MAEILKTMYSEGKITWIQILPIILLFIWIIYFLYTKLFLNKQEIQRSNVNLYGDAHWSGSKTLNKIFGSINLPSSINNISDTSGGLVVHSEKLISGQEKLYYVKDNTHSLVFGSTGSGKTTRIVIPTITSLALAGEDMLVTDPKGELYGYTIKLLEDLDYDIVVVDFTNLKKSMRFNPLQNIINAVNDNDYTLAMQHTNDLVRIIVPDETHNEKIWTNGELSVIGMAILSVVIENKDRPQYQNMMNVYNFLGKIATEDNGFSIDYYLKRLDDNHPAKLMFMVAQAAPKKTRGSFFTSAMTTLRLFTDMSIASITAKTDFSFNSDKKRAIFLIIPDEKDTYNSIATMFITTYYKELIAQARDNGGSLPRRFNYILEEAGNCPPFPDIMSMLTASRSRSIRFNFFLQAIEQLKKIYDENTVESIYANCENVVLLKSNNEYLLKSISERLGTYTVNTSSKSYSKGGNSTNYSLTQRPLMYPHELRDITAPEALLISDKYKFKSNLPFVWDTRIYKLCGMSKDKLENQKIMLEREQRRKTHNTDTTVLIQDIYGL